VANPVFFVDIGADGAVAVHPQRLQLPVLLQPVPADRRKSSLATVREPLVAIGCMRLPHRAFEFDSSFVSPSSAPRFTKFATLMGKLRDLDTNQPKRLPPIALFGHADPTGKEGYNATLSGRRALAVYGLLTRKVALWDQLFKGFGGDVWGRPAVRVMLSTPLKPQDAVVEPPFFVGPIQPPTPADKPALERDTDEAIKQYKLARGAKPPVSAKLDDKTRHQLFEEYMDAICRDADNRRFVLRADAHFIARGKGGKALKGDVQGCGEFNPVFLLGAPEDALLNEKKEFHDARDALYARNRRVLAYIFRHGTEIDPARWPCPKASLNEEAPDVGPCKVRFWSDAKERLALADERREFGKAMELSEPDDDGNFETDPTTGHVKFRDVALTGNTMACRFYHGFAAYSPCEAGLKEWVVRFRVDGFAKPNEPAKPLPLAGRRYVLTMGESQVAAVVRGALDANGELRIPVLDPHVLMTVKLDAFGRLLGAGDEPPPDKRADNLDAEGRFPDEDSFVSLTLDAGALKLVNGEGDENDLASRQRLYNLGFGPNDPAKWDRERDQVPAARAYRQSRKLPDDADLRTKLVEEHELEGAKPPPGPDDDPADAS
jgi:hypothetical protein